MVKGKGVMTKYVVANNALVYPECTYAEDGGYSSGEQFCKHPRHVDKCFYCSAATVKKLCPIDLYGDPSNDS